MRETNKNTIDDQALDRAARDLLDAAMAYHKEYRRAVGRSAVVWLKDTDGRMVVLTRGEHRDQLMANIHNLHRDEERLFGYESPDEDGEPESRTEGASGG